MTREEAKDFLFDMSNLIGTTAIEHWTEKDAEKMRQAVLIIENESAQPEPHYDEWCTDCKEYDKERHCCPRWNRVIRETLKDAQAEPKTGYWHITDAYPHNVYCSECHKKYAQTHWEIWKDGSMPRRFCPNCGVRMDNISDAYVKGEEEE